MSFLIDELIKLEHSKTNIKDKWYIAKPLGGMTPGFIDRVKNAIWVLVGKSFAVHFKEDEKSS